jgi:hypothetical protein
MPITVIIGKRHVGKTTLAVQIVRMSCKKPIVVSDNIYDQRAYEPYDPFVGYNVPQGSVVVFDSITHQFRSELADFITRRRRDCQFILCIGYGKQLCPWLRCQVDELILFDLEPRKLDAFSVTTTLLQLKKFEYAVIDMATGAARIAGGTRGKRESDEFIASVPKRQRNPFRSIIHNKSNITFN